MAATKPSALQKRRVSTKMFESTEIADPIAPPEPPKVPRQKRTFHLPDETVLMLGELQIFEQRKTGKKPELSNLVDTAIRQLIAEKMPDRQTSEHPDTQTS